MKFDDFKIFKFSTISKLSNRIIGNVSKIGKSIKTIPGYAIDFLRLIIKYIFSETNKIIKFFVRNSILKIYKIIDIRKLDFNRIYNYLDIRRYNFYRIDKKIRLGKYKYFPIYFLLIVIFSGFIYLVIPTFYNYDKSRVEKIICKNQNIKCLIKGEVNYRFYPTPRLAIKDLTIEDPAIGKKSIVKAKNTSIKISLKNLLIKKKQNFKKLAFNNFEIIIDLKIFKKYKNTIV